MKDNSPIIVVLFALVVFAIAGALTFWIVTSPSIPVWLKIVLLMK